LICSASIHVVLIPTAVSAIAPAVPVAVPVAIILTPVSIVHVSTLSPVSVPRTVSAVTVPA